MSCCGCASRVLKLQSELRSWKTKLGNEKREKKMILKWILTVFGYDVKVDIDRPTRGIRLEANENKEAASKALLKLVGIGGNEGDFGVMVMEVKLEDNEFFESFEEPHDVPEFPILEINSMPTNTQATAAPILNTGLNPNPYGHLQAQPLNPVPALGISTPMEIGGAVAAPLSLPSNSVVGDQEVVYLAGDFEAGATLEVPNNGQSFIIVRTNENEDMNINSTMPMQMDYSTTGLVGNEDIITDDGSGNLIFGSGVNVNAGMNFLPTINPKQISNISLGAATPVPVQLSAAAAPVQMPIQISFQQEVSQVPVPLPGAVIVNHSQPLQQSVPPPPPIVVVNNTNAKASASKKKSNKSLSSQQQQPLSIPTIPATSTASKSSSKKKKQASPIGLGNETSLRIKSVSGAATKLPSPTTTKAKSSNKQNISIHMQYQDNLTTETATSQRKDSTSTSSCEFGLTLREKAEMYVIQKAKEAVEKVNNNGYRCLVCEENRYTYLNFDSAVAHTKTHFASKPYKCDICDELFSVQRELLTHKKTMHPKPKGPAPGIISGASIFSSSSPMSPRLTQGQCHQSPMKVSSGTVQSSTIVASPPNSNNIPIPGKTNVVQSPFEKNFIRGPISISSEVLAAIFGGNSSVNNQIVVNDVSNLNSDTKSFASSNGGTGSSSSSSSHKDGRIIKLNGIEGANASAAFAQNASFIIKTENE